MTLKRISLILGMSALVAIALEPNYTLPSITYMTPEMEQQESRQRAHRLMELTGTSDGDATLVCTNWVCPTSIVVNAVRYDVVTNWLDDILEFDIMTTNQSPEMVATGIVRRKENEQEARLSAFASRSYTSLTLQTFAQGVCVHAIGFATNMLFVGNTYYEPDARQHLVYKNLHVRYEVMNNATNSVVTNALLFTSEIINAGLPESERVAVEQ